MKFTIAKSNNPISKKFELVEGELVKSDGGNLTMATFDTQSDSNIKAIHDYIKSDACHDKVILIPGTPQYQDGLIVTKGEINRLKNEERGQNLISRTKDCFAYRGGEGFLLFDYDPSEDYSQNDGKPLSKEYLFSILYEVLPEIKGAPMFWKTSSSSYIYEKVSTIDADKGESVEVIERRGLTGQHIFIGVQNNADISRVIDIFYKRLWLNGHGYIFIDKTGRMHDRTIIDKVVNSPEREIFLKAETVKPLFQKMQIELIDPGNKPLNTEVISDLSIDECLQVQALIDEEKRKKEKDANKVMTSYVKAMSGKLGMSPLRLTECIKNHVLYGDSHIKLSTGVEVTVHDLFANPDKYDGEYCYDPLEPSYGGEQGGSTKAWIDLSNKRIHGHAHGGIHYDLEFSDRKSPKQLALEVCDTQDHNIMFKLAAVGAQKMRYIQTEIDQLIDCIAKFSGLKKGSVDKAFRVKFRAETGNDSHSSGGGTSYSGISVDLNSDALESDGSVADGMAQVNLSIPIQHKFPHTARKGDIDYKLDTIENFEFMCKIYKMAFSYDVILKTPEITFPNEEVQSGDNQMNASLSRIKSLSVLNGLGKDSVSYVIELMNANQKNPVLDWVKRIKWDGKSRMQVVQDGIDIGIYGDSDEDEVNERFSKRYKENATKMWFIQCVAALDGGVDSPLVGVYGMAVPKYEYILVFVGSQGIQKTKFIKSLLPLGMNNYILTGHELDIKDKDNIKIAISHWITELGELDSTFRKSDISALKAFMSKEDDQMRMPYARSDSKFRRRTSFCGTVNDVKFLVDNTGNRRYLPMQVESLKPFYQLYVPWVKEDGTFIEIVEGLRKAKKSNKEESSENDGSSSRSMPERNDKEGENGENQGEVVDIFGRELEGAKGRIIGGEKSGKEAIEGVIAEDGVIYEKDVGYGEFIVDDKKTLFTFDNSSYGITDEEDENGVVRKVARRHRCMSLADNAQTQQFWAEVYHYYESGEEWWPSDELENQLTYVFGEHNRVDPLYEMLDEKFDLSWNDKEQKRIKLRGNEYIDGNGTKHRFVCLNYSNVAKEIGVDWTNRKNISGLSSILSNNGFRSKTRRLSKTHKTVGVRLLLRKGQSLVNEFYVGIRG